MRRFPRPSGAALAVATASPPLAQARDEDPTFLGTIRIDRRQAQAVPGNAEIMQDELESLNADTSRVVFRGQSSIQASGGSAIATHVFVNGLEESLLAVTIGNGSSLRFSDSRIEDTGERLAQAGPGGLLFIRPDFAGVVGRESVLVRPISGRTSDTVTWQGAEDGSVDPEAQLSCNPQALDGIGIWGGNTSLSGYAENVFHLGNGTVTAGIDGFHGHVHGYGRGTGLHGGSGNEYLDNLGNHAQARQDLSERLSLSCGARFDGLQIHVDIENLFDTTYASRASDGIGLSNVVAPFA